MNTDYNNILSFSSHLRNLALAEGMIESLAEDGVINEAVFGNVMVAITESVLNAMNHGNQNDPSKMVTIKLGISNDVLSIEVMDEGQGFDYDNLPDPTAPENLEKTSGRGIFIIRNLSDELEFENNGSKMVMSFHLSVPVLTEA